MAAEIGRKLEIMKAAPGDLFAALLDTARDDGLSEQDARRLTDLFDTLSDTPSQKSEEHPLNHPIRVAATWWAASDSRDYETLALALCHNIRENSGKEANAVEEDYLADESREAIATLTIDRARERDPSYLEEYYDRIAAAPGNLMTFKGYDKIDNFLSYALYDLDPYYFAVIDDYVTPRLARTSPQLADYLQRVADYSRTEEARQHWRKAAGEA